MSALQRTSPNFDSRDGQKIDMLVLHYTGMKNGASAIDRLCDETAKVSAHYVVEEDGSIHQLVAEENRAWHAGVSFWRGHTNINQRSIGIEIVNPGHEYGYQPFPLVQMEAVAKLSQDIIKRYKIPARNVVGHSDVAPARKQDPGELFDWEWLAAKGVGLSPDMKPRDGMSPRAALQQLINAILIGGYVFILWTYRKTMQPYDMFLLGIPVMLACGATNMKRKRRKKAPRVETATQVQKKLQQFGYECPQTGQFDLETSRTITAFQRHFRRKSLTGHWDSECSDILDSLLASAR